jgi:hypothetical protein
MTTIDAAKLGITQSMVVQEQGWKDGADDDIRASIEETIGSQMVDDGTDEVVDVVLLWWREGDADLDDELRSSITSLSDEGAVWVLTPASGRPGYAAPAKISEAAVGAGLTSVSTIGSSDWNATRLNQPKTR